MPKFLTMSPTHIPGKKPYAWGKFRDSNYIAIGWLRDKDLTGLSIDQVTEEIRKHDFQNESSAISSFTKFLNLEIGDSVSFLETDEGIIIFPIKNILDATNPDELNIAIKIIKELKIEHRAEAENER